LHEWVRGLPGPNTVIVSLLGRKPDGTSEYSFYPFKGGFDHADKGGSFQHWLSAHYPDLSIEVIEHPTVDFAPIDAQTMAAVAADIRSMLDRNRTIILIDSGGQTRTGAVCGYLGLSEQFE
jgi:hypothetical protein